MNGEIRIISMISKRLWWVNFWLLLIAVEVFLDVLFNMLMH